MKNLILDATEGYIIAKGDVVKFQHDGFDWRVDKVVENKLYVTSEVGGRKAIAHSYDVLTIRRDPAYEHEPDFTGEYILSAENDYQD